MIFFMQRRMKEEKYKERKKGEKVEMKK